MKVVLDTSGYSALLRGDLGSLEVLQSATQVLVPVVVLGELHSGFRLGSRRADNERVLGEFLDRPSVLVVNVTHETAKRYAEIDVYLRRMGKPIPRNDVWIAALTMEHGATLLTHDAHFRELPLLMILP